MAVDNPENTLPIVVAHSRARFGDMLAATADLAPSVVMVRAEASRAISAGRQTR